MDEEHSIQVSFQGGGAKIAELLAAAEAIQEKCTSENVKVSRVAGVRRQGFWTQGQPELSESLAHLV